tara:strand:+ start:1900 stop:2796 length:897 start_codon:yes stop_codon:yes gene_type:complete
MKNKIFITGGAGFIGNELINLISDKKNLVVIDMKKNRKVLNKFKKLRVKYISGNLNNRNFVKKTLKNVKIIYHLAGITKVPNTDVNLDLRKEKIIYNNSVKIMKNLINNLPKNTKIIFPSTHLVFEDCKINKETFYESSRPLPKLAYARGKLDCEKILEKTNLNYFILRLGSVYGFGEKKRMFNLPNLFVLRAKNNQNLKLFSGGVQIKSIVSSKDVARAMIFLSKTKYKKEIYHLVSEHLTVKEIAKNCEKYNKNIKLIPTKDKIPYLGYFINCRKILKTGFKFKINYKNFVKEYLV